MPQLIRFKFCILWLVAIAAWMTAAGASRAETAAPQPGLLFFEDKTPAWIKAAQGDVSISADHYKDGGHALKWDFTRGDTLTFQHNIGFRPFVANNFDQSRHAFTAWVYSAKSLPGAFQFSFYAGKKKASWFSMKADFTGWRAVVIFFEGDMQGAPSAAMDRLVITPPAEADAGTVYFDQMGLSMRVDARFPVPDYQVPDIHPDIVAQANQHWTAMLQFDRWRQSADQAAHQTGAVRPTIDEAAVARIEGKVEAELLTLPPRPLKALEADYKKFLAPEGGLKAISESSGQWATYKAAGISAPQMDYLRRTTVKWHELGKLMRSLAVAYRHGDKAARDRIKTMFNTLLANQIEQGFARGSGQGIMHHQGYVMREWAEALFLMRGELGAQAEAAREALAWYAGIGRIYRNPDMIFGHNADVMNTLLQPMLFSVLMDTAAPRRARRLADLGQWLSRVTLVSNGVAGGLKPDGSVFHHSQHYVAYGNGALSGLSAAVYFLAGTPYAVDAGAHERLRHAVLMTRIFSNGGRFLMGLAGRHPDDTQFIALEPFRYLTLAGAPGRPGVNMDPMVAGAFLRLAQYDWSAAAGPAQKSAMDVKLQTWLLEHGYAPEADPVGSWTMNYSSMALHRRGGWLAGARGFSRYLVGNEAYQNANMFGRYLNYGNLELLPADPARRGFREAGWNWNRWPGTTAIQLPLDALRARVTQVDKEAGVEEMLLSDETYSGGVDFRGEQAMFAMKLHGHPKYGGDLRARKSVFFFENRIIALGSAISSADAAHPVATTVFQNAVELGKDITVFGGEKFTGSTAQMTGETGKADFAVDKNGNGFYFAPGQSYVFQRGVQQSIDEKDQGPTQGAFSTLVLDHGAAPQNAGYEYAIIMQAGKDGARRFASAMAKGGEAAAYKVLERSEKLHAVRDRATGLTAYAAFEAGAIAAPGPALAVSRPAMLMLRASGDRLEGAFVDPDLNLYQGRDEEQYDAEGRMKELSIYSRPWRAAQAQPVVSRLKLRGHWRAASPQENSGYRVVGRDGDATVVEFVSTAAVPIQFSLAKE